MKKIITNPIVDSIITLIIAYLLMQRSWFVGDFITVSIVNIPNIWGFNLYSIMGDDLYYTWFMYFSFIGIWICGLAIIVVFKGYRPILKSFSPKLKGNNINAALVGGLTLGFGLNMIMALVAIATGSVKLHYEGLGLGTFVLLMIAVLVQSGAEELVARVYIYQRLRKNFPKWPVIAILGNGLFFVAMHLNNPGISFISKIVMALVSITYSLVVYYFDSIWIPIVAHTTWNFSQSIILGLPNSGNVFPISMFKLDAGTNNFAFDSAFGVEGSILAITLYIIVCIGLYYFGKKKGAQETNIYASEKGDTKG